jgi:hypothetical protein
MTNNFLRIGSTHMYQQGQTNEKVIQITLYLIFIILGVIKLYLNEERDDEEMT